MEHIGEIRSKPQSDPLRLDDWMTYIASANDFHQIPGRPGINPANGEPIMLRPPANTIRYVEAGAEVAVSHGEPAINIAFWLRMFRDAAMSCWLQQS